MLVRNGVVQMLAAHFSRFHQSCARLHIKNVPFAQIRQTVEDYCLDEFAQSKQPLFVVKILISRGSGGRGYQAPSEQACKAQIFMTKSAFPAHYTQWQQQGICLGVSAVKLGVNPELAGMKHCNRLEQVMIKQQMPPDVDDVVVLDINNLVVECSASNIFWFKNGTWYTPSLVGSGVAGIMRQCILAHIGAKDWDFEYVDVGLTQLYEAESAIVCNSLTGPIVVNQIDFGIDQIRRQGQGDNVVKLNTHHADGLCQLSLIHI